MITKEEIPRHKVLREALRHYLEFRDLVTTPEYGGTGANGKGLVGNSGNLDGIIEYGYEVEGEDGTRQKVRISLSFWDLQGMLKNLSARKREAVFYNVIMDMKQKDVAAIMGITTVSIGQYVEQGMMQLAKDYFDKIEVIVDE